MKYHDCKIFEIKFSQFSQGNSVKWLLNRIIIFKFLFVQIRWFSTTNFRRLNYKKKGNAIKNKFYQKINYVWLKNRKKKQKQKVNNGSFYNKVTDAKNSIAVKEFCRSDSERGSLSSLDIDIRPTEYSTRDSVTSLHYRSLQNQALLPMSVVADVPVRPKHLQCTTDLPSRKRFHTAPREKHRVNNLNNFFILMI